MAASRQAEAIRAAVSQAVAERTFRGKALYDPISTAIFSGHPLREPLLALRTAVGSDGLFRHITTCLIRWSFLVEPVNSDCTSTKFAERWTDRLQADDPRRASFEECCAVFSTLVTVLPDDLRVGDRRTLLRLFSEHSLVPYELPVDYCDRGDGAAGFKIHTAANVSWYWEDDFLHLLRLRAYIDEHRSDATVGALYQLLRDKVHVKTYLTDRALTGDYKTNREKRWEAHPGSPQFAFRRDCLRVEYTLLEQAARFEDFPKGIRKTLIDLHFIPSTGDVYRCPITLDKLSFTELMADVTGAVHGKSKFQVGHLNPLKSAGAGELFGHTPKNIGWISDHGNRIQGHLTMAETRALLERISRNYRELHLSS